MKLISYLLCSALLFMVTSGNHPLVTEVLVPSTSEFVSTESNPGRDRFYLASEDLSSLDTSDHHPDVSDNHPETSDDHPEASDDHHAEVSEDHESLVHPASIDDHHDTSDEHHPESINDHHETSDEHPSIMNTTDLKGDLIDRSGMIHKSNSTELIGNDTDTTTTAIDHDYHTETEEPVDLTVTDANGCLTALRDDMEEKCYDKFQNIVIGAMGESENKQVVCCAVEDYEKCCLRGYQKTHCEGDRQNLKESLKAARLFMAAVSNVSCSEHRGRCDSGASAYTSSFTIVFMALVALFFCL